MRAGGEKRGSSYTRRRRKQKLLDTYGNGTACLCVWCDAPLTFKTVEADRIDPAQGYSFGNVLPACRGCNASRQDNDHIEWLRRSLRERFECFNAELTY